uniref:Uncharacterized protein n=1 Tax=Sphenodon punctatus TaxID=8508 RepID=A0A8D0HAW5_SPHPU
GSSSGETVLTKVESNQTGESLPPETAQLLSSLSSLQPKIFAQLQGLHLQPTLTSTEGATALIEVNNHSPSNLDSIGSVITNHSLVLNQENNLQAGASLTQSNTVASTPGKLPVPDQSLVAMGQLVTVGNVEDTMEGGVHQILLGDVQTIPIRIVDNHPAFIEEKPEGNKMQKNHLKDMGSCLGLAASIIEMG